MESASHSWTPQKQSLAREVEDLRATQKDMARKLASALDQWKRMESDLRRSARDHKRFQHQAEQDRAELGPICHLRDPGWQTEKFHTPPEMSLLAIPKKTLIGHCRKTSFSQ